MAEKIMNIFYFILGIISCIITFVIFTVVVIILSPFVFIAKLIESRRPRNMLWL